MIRHSLRLALKSELIDHAEAQFIRVISRLRNYYAHNVGNMTQSIFDATEIIDKNGDGFNMQRDLLSFRGVLRRNAIGRVTLAFLRPVLFLRFAALLATLTNGIRPPPSISDVMGGLFATGPVGHLKSSTE